ncbi:MAG: sensor histidine kinase [Rubritalea sp.]
MRQFPTILFFLIGLLSVPSSEAQSPTQELSLPELEQRLVDIDNELEQLAHHSLRSGIGSIGYRSNFHESPHTSEWVEIELEKETQLDEIVLIPAIRRDTNDGFQADAFPVAFQIIAGTDKNRTGDVVAEYKTITGRPVGIAPLIIDLKGITASWVRLEASELSKRAFDGKYLLQLSELMIFSGDKNVALRRPIKKSSNHKIEGIAWDQRYLVDGHTPYLMDTAHGEQSLGFLSKPFSLPTFLIDLGKPTPLSSIHLHSLDQSDTIPQAQPGDLGIPQHLLITGANLPDQSDAITLLDFKKENIQDSGPIMMWNIPETPCRYIQISAIDPVAKSRFGFAEIELISEGVNVALKETVQIDNTLHNKQLFRKIEALTDGKNFYGEILPIRLWLNQLARRQELEIERPLVAATLQTHYERQKENLKRMKWLAALLAAGTVIIILIDRVIRQRAVFQTRKRIAANLHDELGANLHAIGLFGDLAKHEVDKTDNPGQWDQLVKYVTEIRTLTEHTGKTARYCANMLEADNHYADLVSDMTKVAEQLSADLMHQISFKNGELLQNLPPRRRIGVLLFYKECIANIIRHADATLAETCMVVEKNTISLTVYDNGKGIKAVPSSLKRRARLLKGTLSVENLKSGGTQITLNLRT